ncbi:MAG TPA: hypothetical protein VGK74_19415 [Symbiobacteriaceae bacterium]|jgi:hypothetical protein
MAWQMTLYLLLGLGVFGGVFYALTQIAGRQRRLHAELTRLEQLTAEVAMTAEAMLDKIDERIERLNRIANRVDAQVESRVQALDNLPEAAPPAALQAESAPLAVPAALAAAVQPAAAAEPPTTSRKRGRPRKHPVPSGQQAAAAPQTPAQTTLAQPLAPQSDPGQAATDPSPRNAKVQSVYALAAEGKTVPEIAAALSLPRGEVQLILNLRKVTA